MSKKLNKYKWQKMKKQYLTSVTNLSLYHFALKSQENGVYQSQTSFFNINLFQNNQNTFK